MRPKIDWPAVAEALCGAIGRGRWHPEVLRWAAARPAGEGWAVAFSGGADSLCLLLLLWAGWPKRRRRLRALHFDHRLRGAESRADAAFCGRVCAALGVPFVQGAWADPGRATSEASAREARFGFFRSELRRRRLGALWLGHQRDDIVETLFMRLARGSGSAGLAAPRPIQVMPWGWFHVRPLLDLGKGEIRAALRAAGAQWREDSSNAGDDFFRNRLRRDVIPRWERAAGRNAAAGAALSRGLLDEDNRALEAWVDELDPISPAGTLDAAKLAGRPRAVVRRALHRWLLLQADAGELSRPGFELLLAAVQAGRPTRQSLGTKGFAVIGKGKLVFKRASLGRPPPSAGRPRPTAVRKKRKPSGSSFLL